MVALLTMVSLEVQPLRSSFGKVFMGAAGGVDLPSDDQFNRVSFLSHFEGSNEGINNVFIDGHDTSNPHTITKNGNVTQGSFGPFARPDGEWAVTFDGLNDSYLTTPNSSDFAFGTGDFTIEFWFNPNHTDTGYILDSRGTGVNGFRLYRAGASGGDLVFSTAGSGSSSTTVDANTVNNNWYHFCATRASGVIKFFINGSQVGSDVNDTSNITSTDLNIGASYGESLAFTGIISNLRIIKGTAVNPTELPTSAATNVTNTVLLTCQSNRFVDNSSSGHTITPDGGVAVTSFGAILTSSVYDAAVNGASAYFDDAGDYLSIADNTDFDLNGESAFTIEAWLWPSSESGTGNNKFTILSKRSGSNGYLLLMTGSNVLQFYAGSFLAASSLSVGAWHHVAAVKISTSSFKIYVNGVEEYTTSSNINPADVSTALTIGADEDPAREYNGYMSDVRIVKGAAVYTSAFTPPTAPLAVIDSNTKLLLNMANGQAIDSAAQNNLTLYGSAKLSTGQAKFGNTSILFNGNSDFLTFPHSESNDISGAGNWTVEFFWRFVDNNATQYQEIATKGIGFQIYGNNGALSFALSANNTTTYFLSANNGTTLSDNTWYHIAAVKNGTAYNVYLNGTNEANLDGTSSSNVDTGTDPWCLGAYTSNGYYANGYMDEFRVSQFARYTSNFTAPAEPFADKGQ